MSVTARTARSTTQVGIPGERAVSRSHLIEIEDCVGNVHSVFASACNLALGGRLVAVHDAGRSHTPTSITVQAPGPAPWAPSVRQGAPVIQRDGWLQFGRHLLDVSDLAVWQPAALPMHSWEAGVQPARQLTLLQSFRAAHSEPLDPRIDCDARALATTLAAAPVHRTEPEMPDPQPGIDTAVKRLVGFGPGLTPAGDDILVGLLAVLDSVSASTSRRHGGAALGSAADRLRTAISRYYNRTTDISAHYLAMAVDGHFAQSIDDLILALAVGQSDQLLLARATAVISIGASSGADTLRGVVAGLALALAEAPPQHSKENFA